LPVTLPLKQVPAFSAAAVQVRGHQRNGPGTDKKEKGEVAGAGDAAADGTTLERDGEPAVPVFDAMEEGTCSDGAFAQGGAGIRIQQERLASAEGNFDRLGGIVAPDSAGGHHRFRGEGILENGFESLALRILLRRGAKPAFGPVD
jgi:hypothetical protein